MLMVKLNKCEDGAGFTIRNSELAGLKGFPTFGGGVRDKILRNQRTRAPDL